MTFAQAMTELANLIDAGHPPSAAEAIIVARAVAERRERIATAALQGLLSQTQRGHGVMERDTMRDFEYEVAAQMAVEHADALIVELDKPRGAQ